MDKIKTFFNSIAETNNLLKIFDIQVAAAVIIGVILFRHLLAKIVIRVHYKIIRSRKNVKESKMYRPLNNFFLCIGIFVAVHIALRSFEETSYEVKQFLFVFNKMSKIIGIYYFFRFMTYGVQTDSLILKRFFSDPTNNTVNSFICKIIRAVMWIIFIFIAISEIGYDLSGLLTALGLGSAALALAAQDLVKSLISGASILTDKPFAIGDWIEVGEIQGAVIDITFRSVRIKSFNNAVVTVPNSVITATSVINWNRLTSRRFDCILNLKLETPSEKIKKLVTQLKLTLQTHENVIRETVQVSLNNISASSLDIKIFLYVNEANYNRYLKIKQEIFCILLDILAKENIDLAYPTQTLYIEK